MTPPVRYNVRQAAKLIGKSPSWLYKQGAAGNVVRSKLGHNVFWTPEQIAQIIAGAAQEPKKTKREKRQAEQKRTPQPPKREVRRKRTPPPANSNIPQADFSVSRLYRDSA